MSVGVFGYERKKRERMKGWEFLVSMVGIGMEFRKKYINYISLCQSIHKNH